MPRGLLYRSELFWCSIYADDIVLLAPTPSAISKLLNICDDYAREYSIISFLMGKNPSVSSILVLKKLDMRPWPM